ncbi:hypothetical protein [Amycolatopsis pigmentata]|uniref:Uncharacterized protein n=1 Tax=Amycolatopsis pigmentata TaxID=450801 RepID=A0ABW5G594_9PSEU
MNIAATADRAWRALTHRSFQPQRPSLRMWIFDIVVAILLTGLVLWSFSG